MNPNGTRSMSGTGYLLVRVSTAQGAIPVPGATVTVRDGGGTEADGTRGNIIRVLTTDRDGRTERLALAAPPKSDSAAPNGVVPYANYNIDVEAPGFYRLFFSAVPVYDTITSIQPALLIPIAQNGNQDGVSDEESYIEENVNPALRERPVNPRGEA